MDIKDSIIDQLIFSTVRIECIDKNNQLSTGTGYFFGFITPKGHKVPAILTNNHVIEEAVQGKFYLTLQDDNGNPNIGKYYYVKINDLEKICIKHPDDNVDIAAILLAPILRKLEENKVKTFLTILDKELIPSDESLKELFAMENIIMIGYPNGIWDSVNNLPILRRGITATPAFIDYNGKTEFMIDAACFPGSSGSPVFLFDSGIYSIRESNTIGRVGGRCWLLGTLYAGPQHTITGNIKIIDIPTKEKAVAISRIPNNLGLVIKSRRILEFENAFDKKIN